MKVVVVTGATRGLGLAISRRLMAEGGYHVIGVSRSKSDGFQAIESRPGKNRIDHVSFDLTHLDGIAALVAAIRHDYGKIYGLVNNAGVGASALLTVQQPADIAALLALNIHATIMMTKYVCRSMLASGVGRVVNISSVVAQSALSGLAVYAATKAALEGFTRALAEELAMSDITVNSVAPGFMQTQMTSDMSADYLQSIRQRNLLAELGDAANVVAGLLGPDGGRTTGSTIRVHGGRMYWDFSERLGSRQSGTLLQPLVPQAAERLPVQAGAFPD